MERKGEIHSGRTKLEAHPPPVFIHALKQPHLKLDPSGKKKKNMTFWVREQEPDLM